MTTCAAFDEAADELAVGTVSEPARSELLAHASTCAACGARLRDLVAVADLLLVLAPPAEPPPGFETRVLDSLRPTRASWPRRARRPLAATAALLLLLVGVALVVTRSDGVEPRRAPIVAAGGAVVGEVVLVAEPRPHVLVLVDQPRRSPGERACELLLPDGERVVVGSWGYDEIERGVWSVGIEEALLDATSMRIIDGDRVVATGRFD